MIGAIVATALLFAGCLMVGGSYTPLADVTVIQLWGVVFCCASLGVLTRVLR